MSFTQHQDDQVPGAGFAQFYPHPDGHALMFDAAANQLHLFSGDSFVSVAVPIGPQMLVEVGERMAALGKKLQGKF